MSKSLSPDAKVVHGTGSNENFHHQKHAAQHGTVQLSPIHDQEHHTNENVNDNLLLNRSDTKMSSRTTLGMNITAPGGDLPVTSSQGLR